MLADLSGPIRCAQEMAEQFVEAYRRYCWPVDSIDDLKLAPFHLLATEGGVHVNKDHIWHMETLADLCERMRNCCLLRPATWLM